MRSVNEDRLKQTLEYILAYQKRESRAPTYRQIQKACKYTSLGTVAADVARLKERSLIESSNEGGWHSIKLPNRLSVEDRHNCFICGAVPCGQPSPAIEDIEATVALPNAIFGCADHIILHAVGPSMIKRGMAGCVILKRQHIYEPNHTSLIFVYYKFSFFGTTIIAEKVCKRNGIKAVGKLFPLAPGDIIRNGSTLLLGE